LFLGLGETKKNKTGGRERAARSNSNILGWKKMPKNDCPKNVQNPLGSKTSYNGSNKALFESKIQTKKQYSLRAVEQKIFIFMNCTRNLKKTKGI